MTSAAISRPPSTSSWPPAPMDWTLQSATVKPKVEDVCNLLKENLDMRLKEVKDGLAWEWMIIHGLMIHDIFVSKLEINIRLKN
jgi:hypothetical protein